MTLRLTYTGVNYTGDVFGSFKGPNSLGTLTSYNVNSVAITADFGINAENNTIYQNDVDGGFTENDADITAAAQQAVADGLTVMIRPLIDFLPDNYKTDPSQENPNPLNGPYYANEFRNYYNPGPAGSAGANAFFASYKTMIVDQAEIAQASGAQLLSIGAEIDQLTGPAYKSYWDDIISAVKAVYSGKLTYSANWDDGQGYWQYSSNSFAAQGETGSQYITGNIATQVSFWNELDYVGIDQYAPISDAANPTEAQLVAGWTQAPTDPTTSTITGGQSLISYYENIASQIGKPMMFTELGYANSTDAASSPATPGYDENGNADSAKADATLQANLYQAFFQAWSEAGNTSLVGTFMWNWEPGGAGISDFSPQGLQAATQLKDGYQEALCYLRGTRILTRTGEVAVETLQPGDSVVCFFGGVRRIKWIGRQSYSRRFLKDNRDMLPVCIAAGALGEAVPARDLFVSPGHSVLIGDTLVLAKSLVNGLTITQSWAPDEVHYYNLELEAHDCVLAEGSWAETYADCAGMRARFHNAPAFFAQFPDWVTPDDPALCAPRPLVGAGLDAVLRPVVARAMAGYEPGRLRGYLETIGTDGTVHGWAFDESHPEAPVLLELCLDDTVVGTVLACDPRDDLRQAGLARGRCSFAWASARPPEQLARLRVRRAADGAALPVTDDWRQRLAAA